MLSSGHGTARTPMTPQQLRSPPLSLHKMSEPSISQSRMGEGLTGPDSSCWTSGYHRSVRGRLVAVFSHVTVREPTEHQGTGPDP